MELLDTTVTIDTPECVRFRYRIAGPGPRAIAWTIDFFVRVLFGMLLMAIVLPWFTVSGLDGIGTGMLLLGLFLIEWFYGVLFETYLSGQTPGKKLLSLRVVRSDGAPARFPDFLLRNLLRAADFLPFGFAVGVATMLVDRRMRRLGDMVAGTVVVVEERTHFHGELRVEPPVSEEERRALPSRVDLNRQELAVIEAFLRRRHRFSDERAEELAWNFGPALAERTGIQANTWERTLTLAYARATGKDRTP